MPPGAFGGEDEEERDENGELLSVVEARREAEEQRREKHRKMESEREDIRQGIRDKVGWVKPNLNFEGFYLYLFSDWLNPSANRSQHVGQALLSPSII